MRKLATVGDNCIDYYVKQNKMFPGGNCVNVAVYAARAGLSSSYTGAVGNDEYGSFMRDALRKKGVDASHLYVLAGKTAVTRVELVNGERVFGDYDEGVLRDYKMSDADVDFFCRHDLLHTALWGNAERELKRIKERGLPVVFDFATAKDGEILETALPFVDYAFFSREEETGELLEYMQDIQKKGPRLVVATLGENGSIAWDGAEFFRFGVLPTKVVDSMGAGDSYIAGFCKGIIEKLPVVECMRTGSQCAAETLRYMGAW